MRAVIEAPVAPDEGWRDLFMPQPEACPVHHGWVDECPAGTHDDEERGE